MLHVHERRDLKRVLKRTRAWVSGLGKKSTKRRREFHAPPGGGDDRDRDRGRHVGHVGGDVVKGPELVVDVDLDDFLKRTDAISCGLGWLLKRE